MQPQMNLWFDKMLFYGTSIFVKLGYCIFILILCFLFIRLGRRAIRHAFNNKRMDVRKANTMNGLADSILKYAFYFIAISTILKVLGVADASIVAVAGIGSVAIGFGTQSLVKDIISGFFILLEDQYGVGDVVTIEGLTGTVEEIGIRTTRLRAASGEVYIIPNGSVNIVVNQCKEFVNATVDVDIDYQENMNHVLAVLQDEMQKAQKALPALRNTPTVLGITNLGESGVTVRITAECNIKENYRVERELRLLIKNRLDQENISMPFPQRTIHLVQTESK